MCENKINPFIIIIEFIELTAKTYAGSANSIAFTEPTCLDYDSLTY